MHESAGSVESTQPSRRRRKWPRRLVFLLLLSPLLFFLLSNVLLRTPWCCQWIGAKLSKKAGLDTSFTSAGWLPGGDIWIEDLIMQQPAVLRAQVASPLLRVKKISLRPVWSEVIKGRRDFTSVTVETPELSITIEMLADLLRRSSPEIPPQTASPSPAAQPPTTVAQGKAAEPAPQPAPPDQPATPPPEKPPAPAIESAKATGWLHVHNCRISLLHAASTTTLLDITGMNATVPFEGKQAAGKISISRVASAGNSLTENLLIPLQWKEPLLETPLLKFDFLTMHGETKAQMARIPGLPFQWVVQQKDAAVKTPDGNFSAASVQSAHRIGGYLIAPGTWNGESLGEANDITARWQNQDAEFFTARYRIILARGALQCTEARALGDNLALMGNGVILADGRLAAILRVAASRSTATGLEERIKKLFPETTYVMANFMNEDRRAADFLFGGSLEQTFISLDQGKTPLDLRKIIAHLLQQNPLSEP